MPRATSSWYHNAPPINVRALSRRSKSLALLDQILAPDDAYREFDFDSKWGDGEAVATWRNGEGDHYALWFSEVGTVIRGFDHESAMSPFRHTEPAWWPRLTAGIPAQLRCTLEEPAFGEREMTFLFWRSARARRWHHGPVELPVGDDPDGSGRLLALLDGEVEDYLAYAVARFDVALDAAAVAHVYEHGAVDAEWIRRLNPEVALASALDRAQQLGFPTSRRMRRRKGATAMAKPKVGKKRSRAAKEKARKPGSAEFRVVTKDGVVSLVVHDKAIASSDHEDAFALYNELFDFVADRLKRPPTS
ncbi:MAG: hypothetical protein DRI90_11470 [Deltaproteobacteria bacterium]|nr:MAG: hypothetical protein DRI90_11470 [Deltaproteobacteria bacterium]